MDGSPCSSLSLLTSQNACLVRVLLSHSLLSPPSLSRPSLPHLHLEPCAGHSPDPTAAGGFLRSGSADAGLHHSGSGEAGLPRNGTTDACAPPAAAPASWAAQKNGSAAKPALVPVRASRW
ncbi:hypothetical protein BRADI_3g21284v3 [Brachypodium distachyon]|uniref:Uncharacterized protein n=1 Tax=Brachypodium distachyon TaxID=15368 RepID=A0A2K2CYM2_BRADI|nr:hypothetical protein BRADI_3g21284v3 [Brachypodium distachyon]